VRPFPEGAGRWQASVEGGGKPRWSPDGRELFYVSAGKLFSVQFRRDREQRSGSRNLCSSPTS
jgi:hypothetical protein